MATITELLNPINSRDMMANSIYYQCRRPASLSSPWHFGKRPKKRHSASLSLFDNSSFGGDITESNSLPATPLSFVSFEDRQRTSLGETAKCDSDITSLLSTSGSSGYCSGFSDTSSLGSSPYSYSTSPSFSYFLFSKKSKSTSQPTSTTIPLDLPTSALNPPSKETVTNQTVNDDFSNNWSQYTSQSSEYSQIVTSSPLTDTSITSASVPRNSSNEACSSRLTSVSVPSKRRNSESSSSSGSAISDDAIRQRVKDDEGFIRRAACLCVNEDESKVVLISSKNEGGGWLVPGGGLESGEGEAEAAEREAWEEAGITGNVKRCLGVFQSEDEATNKKKRTAVYVLTVQEEHSVFPEASLGRVREWFSIDTAVQNLSRCKPHQIAYLRAL